MTERGTTGAGEPQVTRFPPIQQPPSLDGHGASGSEIRLGQTRNCHNGTRPLTSPAMIIGSLVIRVKESRAWKLLMVWRICLIMSGRVSRPLKYFDEDGLWMIWSMILSVSSNQGLRHEIQHVVETLRGCDWTSESSD